MTSSDTSSPLLSIMAWLAAVASSLSFAPLLNENSYVVVAAVLAAGPLAAALLLRRFRAPAAVVLLGQLGALAVWGTLVHFRDTAVGGLLPTETTADAFGAQLAAGVQTANEYAAPAPAVPGLVLLTAVAVTGCYLMVDFVGVGLGRVPLTGLPLLALYTVPAALAPDGVPVPAFVPPAAAFLLLLAYDERERLGHWGRQISTITGIRSEHEQRRLNSSAVNASAARVGGVALGAAAVLPLFIPVLPEGWLGVGPGSGGGKGEFQVANPIVDIRRDLVERSREVAMTVRTESDSVSYFRLAALDEFDGEKWKFSNRDVDGKFDLRGGLSDPPGMGGDIRTRRERFLVSVAPDFGSDWLPTPYAPSRVLVDGEWRYDPATLDIVAAADDESAAGRRYAVSAIEPLPTFDQLDGAEGAPTSISGRYTDIPDGVPPAVGARAEQITAQGASRFQRAVLLQEWFRVRGGFRYSLETPDGHSGNDILSFLNQRVGYCEQFAASMALMARELNIPARVAVGFLNAQPASGGPPGLFRYTFADMHAWPELYFEGVGWVRFEPTPADRSGAAAPPYTAGDAAGAEPLTTNQPTAPPAQAVPRDAPRNRLALADPTQASGGAGNGGPPWLPIGAGVTLLVLLLPASVRIAVRRRRLATATGSVGLAEAVWLELRDATRDLGYDWPVDTPRRTSARLVPLVRRREGAESALRRLALNVERVRFARTPGDASTLKHDLDVVVRALRSRESRWDLVKSRLLPRSLRAAYRRQNRADAQRFRNLTLDVDASALQAAP